MAFVNLGLTTDEWNYEWPGAAPMHPDSPWTRYNKAAIPPRAIPSNVLWSWTPTVKDGPGYWRQRGCYCWGYRPAIARLALGGLGGGSTWDGGTIDPATGEPWWICSEACPEATCPPAPVYPAESCPPQLTCPPAPAPCPTPDMPAPCPTKAEINIWWIAGAAMVGIAGGRWWKQRR